MPLANIKVARFNGERLRYVGALETGFSKRVATALRKRLDGIAAPRPVACLKVTGAVWSTPDLRAEIAFCGLTGSGKLRAASFKGLLE